jgi:dihydroorotate dehydrogenase
MLSALHAIHLLLYSYWVSNKNRMSDTLKIEQRGQGVINHDYRRGIGDFFLEMGKSIIRNPEVRHKLLPTFAAAANFYPVGRTPSSDLEKTIRFFDRSMPITLGSPIILAAGGNKFAENLPAFTALGFGGVTVGSATSSEREGNPFRPRMRMLPLDRSMSNSMGLNNPGIEVIAHEVDKALGHAHRRKLALGISVADTPGMEDADDKIADVLATFRRAYRAADYIELNVSCPNTGLDRLDRQEAFLADLLHEIMEARKSLAPKKAVFVKLSPDLSAHSLDSNLQIISDAGVTGLVLFNTFPGEKSRYLRMQSSSVHLGPVSANGGLGGLSGRVLYKNTLPAVQYIRKQLPKVTIFASGGIDHGSKVMDLLDAGADAVQCYTVLAYRWNAIRKMNRELLDAMHARGVHTLDGYAPPA